MFAGFQHLQSDFHVRPRNSEINDEFDLGVCEEFVNGECLAAVSFCLRLGGFHPKISACLDV